MKYIFRKIIAFFLGLLPAEAPEYIYTVILRPPPLRWIAGRVLSFIIPEHIKYEDGLIVALNKNDPTVSGALMLGVYEKAEADLFRRLLKPGMVVVDIGANIGCYTAIAADAVGNSGSVIAFEPDPENFSFLEKTISLNNFKNVDLHKVALSNFSGESKLFISKENKGDHKIYDSGENRSTLKIKTTTLDRFAVQNNLEQIDLMKMDIQGAEGLALSGMKEIIKKSPSIKLITELWPGALDQSGSGAFLFLKTLQELGFSIFEMDENGVEFKLVSDFHKLISGVKGRGYNIYCEKKSTPELFG